MLTIWTIRESDRLARSCRNNRANELTRIILIVVFNCVQRLAEIAAGLEDSDDDAVAA